MSLHTETITTFSPPGNLNDLTPENKVIWSEKYISKWMNDEIAGGLPGPCDKPRTALPQFFNGTKTPFETEQQGTTIEWNAFPNLIKTRYTGRQPLCWQMADATRLSQDEYLEWSVARNQDRKVTSVKFTCEGPEYWQFLGDYQPDTLFQLAKELNPEFADQMSKEDFFLTNQQTGATVYNPMNYWNMFSTSGTILHLAQPNNALSAEIDIAAQATVMRINGQNQPITDSLELLSCSKYGNAGRNSDPRIGSEINALCRLGTSISLENPVALYIKSCDTSSLKLRLGPNKLVPLPKDTFKYPRGPMPQAMRIHVEIPQDVLGDDGSQLTVGDIWDTTKNQPIEYGAQLAEYIQMSVIGVAIPNVAVADAIQCPCKVNYGDIMPGRGTFDGIIRDGDGVEQHRLPKYNFRVR